MEPPPTVTMRSALTARACAAAAMTASRGVCGGIAPENHLVHGAEYDTPLVHDDCPPGCFGLVMAFEDNLAESAGRETIKCPRARIRAGGSVRATEGVAQNTAVRPRHRVSPSASHDRLQ